MIQRGTKVIGVWGALHAESHGEISSISTFDVGPSGDAGTEVAIMWDNGSVHHAMLNEIRDDYLGTGTQIGLYVNPFENDGVI
tara:strand:+ start:166 stop:414 length:249 start_codon:yes stop_codon:yes gene_type:complete